MSASQTHQDLIRDAFTSQAAAYAANPHVSASRHMARWVQLLKPAPDDRVLDIATGPGQVASAFAHVCRDEFDLLVCSFNTKGQGNQAFARKSLELAEWAKVQ